MNFTLNRISLSEQGVFGVMIGEDTSSYHTLEHSFQQQDGNFAPKVAIGTYNCIRHAPNRLPYETFEIANVPDFMGEPVTGILIHIGNYNKDSDGCILIGKSQVDSMVTNSKEAFGEFMNSLKDVSSFELTIK